MRVCADGPARVPGRGALMHAGRTPPAMGQSDRGHLGQIGSLSNTHRRGEGSIRTSSADRSFSYPSSVIRRLVVATAVTVLAVAGVVAAIGNSGGARYTRAEVVRAFAEQGFGLRDARREIRGTETPLYREGRLDQGVRHRRFPRLHRPDLVGGERPFDEERAPPRPAAPEVLIA
jgi:hypothetical protein